MQNCFPDQVELGHLNLHQQKANTIAKTLAQSVQQITYGELKMLPYSLHFDETSPNRYKYGTFLARRVKQDFSSVESVLLDIYDIKGSNADQAFLLYQKYIVQTDIEPLLVGVCLDNCNAMRGKDNSFTTRLQSRKNKATFPPCILHVLNLCEKSAFNFIPEDIVSLYRSLYNYFSSSLKRTDEFIKLPKKLGIDLTLITQPAHTRWLSWCGTISKVNKKWKALEEYFKKPRLTNNLALMRLFRIPIEDDNSTEDEIPETSLKETEKTIKATLEKPETYLYSLFLESSLNHNSKYVKLFEKDNLDVSQVYSLLLEYCEYYINKLRKFSALGIKTQDFMKNFEKPSYQEQYFMELEEYSTEFVDNFPTFDFEGLDQEVKVNILNATKKYYLEILIVLKKYIDFDNIIFRELQVLQLSYRSENNISVWKS